MSSAVSTLNCKLFKNSFSPYRGIFNTQRGMSEMPKDLLNLKLSIQSRTENVAREIEKCLLNNFREKRQPS